MLLPKMIGRTARNSIRLSCCIRPAYSTNPAVKPPITQRSEAQNGELKVYSNAELNNMTLDQWAEAFKKETVEVAKMDITTISYDESASRMRRLLKTRILTHNDIVIRPERFFLAHRLLAHHSCLLGPGFWIRFTVHYNLCVGTIVALGSTDQVQVLQDWQNQGQLGCFSLTEKFAGVNSGMIVHTTATWDSSRQSFILSTPAHGAKKNWISQGLVADKTVVVADLVIDNKSYGPHGFMMDLREHGDVVNGVSHGDMGKKSVGNDLDNAWIAFNNVVLPKESLLNKYADIVDNQYVQHIKDRPIFHMIGQRLFTGRVAVAQGALTFQRRLFAMTKEYTDNKMCWSPKGEVPLSSIPQLSSIYAEEKIKSARLEQFLGQCEMELSVHLKDGTLPSIQLVEAIAAAKVLVVEEAINLSFRLKNEVGSYALMAGTGFDQTDFLQCCKFAEGDSRILMQKMSRDRMLLFEKDGVKMEFDAEDEACTQLAAAMQHYPNRAEAWDGEWERVYQLADLIMVRIVKSYLNKK